jgi:hypothetical protein
MPSVSGFATALISASALSAACSAEQPPTGATPPVPSVVTPSQPPERVPEPPATPPVKGEAPADLIATLRADLAKQTGVSASEAQLIRAEAVVWPDGGLGCPKAGEMYTQATVPGYWIEFELASRVYSYHATEKGYFRLCPSVLPQPPNPVT